MTSVTLSRRTRFARRGKSTCIRGRLWRTRRLHIELDVDPRTLLAFEDAVLGLPDEVDPPDEFHFPLVLTWSLPPMPTALIYCVSPSTSRRSVASRCRSKSPRPTYSRRRPRAANVEFRLSLAAQSHSVKSPREKIPSVTSSNAGAVSATSCCKLPTRGSGSSSSRPPQRTRPRECRPQFVWYERRGRGRARVMRLSEARHHHPVPERSTESHLDPTRLARGTSHE